LNRGAGDEELNTCDFFEPVGLHIFRVCLSFSL
jgi:hypothetical protein